ncbi:hypothetical protein [Halomonas sp. 15WGF]|uniref:hypothetical protein n=1 Tax=Halomonas sp. 15WGF TaxID=2570357 RepID=UPI0010BEE9AC|nr:hypothetical protein [Halomonas sp. 15WGF]
MQTLSVQTGEAREAAYWDKRVVIVRILDEILIWHMSPTRAFSANIYMHDIIRGEDMNDASQFWIGISPILFIMIATLIAGGYTVYNNIKRFKDK